MLAKSLLYAKHYAMNTPDVVLSFDWIHSHFMNEKIGRPIGLWWGLNERILVKYKA